MNAEFFWKMVKREVDRQQTSFEWLYRKTGIPKGTFSSWKTRNIIPRADEAYLIAEALGCRWNTSLTAGMRPAIPLIHHWKRL
ncbi:helix-turn-helix domain containing protein [Treponema primitia]|uniref:helix-turn-helix domain-containing protein n=1 Tax=Treponema primitia TaxID=88058 RepID=UPI00398077C9